MNQRLKLHDMKLDGDKLTVTVRRYDFATGTVTPVTRESSMAQLKAMNPFWQQLVRKDRK